MSYIVPNGTAASFPVQAGLDSGDLAVLVAGRALTGVATGCAVTAQATPNMTVAVGGGLARVGGKRVLVTGGNVAITAANATNPRRDLVTVDATGAAAVVTGTAGAYVAGTSQPVYAAIPAGRAVLAAVDVPAGATSIGATYITDKRVNIADPRIDGSRVGFAMGSGGLAAQTSAEINARLDLIVALGASWVRWDFDWSLIQSVNVSTYDWSTMDTISAAVTARGLKAIGTLTYTPSWARAAGTTNKYPPTTPGDFGSFAFTAANRYYPNITHWECWNEPNLATFWAPTASYTSFYNVMNSCWDGVHSAHNDCTVIMGGLAPASTDGSNIAPIDFVTGMYTQTRKAFDAVALHPYTYPVTTGYELWNNAWGDVERVRQAMVTNGEAGKKIYLTEYGAPTNGPGNAAAVDAYTGDTHVTTAMQALSVQNFLDSCQARHYFGPVLWYSLVDAGTATTTQENFFGIVDTTRAPKPAYWAMQAALGAYQ